MLRIFLIIIYSLINFETAFAVGEKTVKIDVESLGLDNVDQKLADKKTENPKVNILQKIEEKKPTEIVQENLPPISQQKDQPKKELEQIKTEPSTGGLVGIMSKIQNLKVQDIVGQKKSESNLNKESKKDEVLDVNKQSIADQDSKKKEMTQKYINSEKKRNLKKRLTAEKSKKENEKKHKEKLVKLNELRKKYLIKINEDVSSKSKVDIDEEDDEKIIPHRKEISHFVSDEEPALPLMDRVRASDNRHIPMQLTQQDDVVILFDTIAKGNVAFFNSAYKNFENPNVKNQLGDTILTCAALLQKQPIIASILAKGADPNMPNGLGYTPIDIAIELLDSKSLELLVDNNADVKYVDAFGRTYLMHAARVGFLPAVELFVSKGVDINAMDKDGFTALAIAYRHKKEVIVKYLLKNGAKTWIEKPYNPEDQSLIKELENRWK
jgi:ankyrin repeat protein